MCEHATVKVGYMGIPFSNTEAMSKVLSAEIGLNDYELVPLMSAVHVVNALLDKKIDYGVLAINNKFAGTVIESRDALEGHDDIKTIRKGWCPIHHCVFTKTADSKIDVLSSHIQALLQSQNNLKALYPDAKWEESEDTAYSAEMLAKGVLPDNYAAVCRRDAGEYYGLYMVHENVEDNKENMTEFSIIELD